MSTRKTTIVYAVLIAFAAGMVIASQLDLTPQSSAQTLAMPAMNSAPVTGALDAQTFRNVAKAQSPMVVNIKTEMPQRARELSDFFGGGGQPPDDLLERFFGQPRDPRRQGPQTPQAPQGPPRRAPRTEAAGTGFIISRDGLILTNNHVVEDATKITVSLFGEDDDQEYEAKLVGRDQLSDSALIQLIQKPNHALPEARFGDSSQMAAGDWVVAIGNPFGQGWTVTVGVISATSRDFPVTDQRRTEMIQTDAAINPGNSGGPLLNLRGEVIGMNSAIFTNGQGNIGIGFAVPINTVRELLPQLHTGKVTRGRLGVSIDSVPIDGYQDFGLKTRTGAYVSSVQPGSAADKGGMRAGDVILEFNGRAVPNSSDLVKMVTATKPGTSVPVKVLRQEGNQYRERTLTVVVDELDLVAEQQGGRGGRPNAPDQQTPDQQGDESFGLNLRTVTPEVARQLKLPAGQRGAAVIEVDPNGPAARGLREGDVIMSINGVRIETAADAAREFQRIESGRNARILLWRNGAELFVIIRKE
jgi:serine protease Do